MPTIFSHGASVILLGKTLLNKRPGAWFWFWVVILSMLPDVDVVGFAFGIKYGDFFGHRGFTHSLVFALGLSVVIVMVFRQKLNTIRRGFVFWVIFYFLVIASHGIFDGLTDGGLGIAYFSPFDDTRYFLPWTPVEVSPIGVKGFLSIRGVEVLVSEGKIILFPLILIYLGVLVIRKLRRVFRVGN